MSGFLASVTLKGTKIGGFILNNPMSKNGLVKNSVSRNQVVSGNPAMHTDYLMRLNLANIQNGHCISKL